MRFRLRNLDSQHIVTILMEDKKTEDKMFVAFQ